jgi:DNA polymerase-3 subunit delta'
MAARDAFPHALLFVGPAGAGKVGAALQTAMALNCARGVSPDGLEEIDACACRSCRKIRSGAHPDLHRIAPDGPRIRIDRVRDLIRRMSMRPNEARIRVAIIEAAGALNPEAGNALLKLLEEPPDRTVLILTAAQPSDLLPTLVSRCRTLRFLPPPRRRRGREFADRFGLTAERALALAALPAPAPPADAETAAFRLGRRDWVIDTAAAILRGEGPPALPMAFAERLAADRDAAPAHLAALQMWLRDRIVGPRAPEAVFFPDRDDRLAGPSGPLDGGRLIDILQAVETARRRLESNANARLTLEAMTLRFAEIHIS